MAKQHRVKVKLVMPAGGHGHQIKRKPGWVGHQPRDINRDLLGLREHQLKRHDPGQRPGRRTHPRRLAVVRLGVRRRGRGRLKELAQRESTVAVTELVKLCAAAACAWPSDAVDEWAGLG